MVQQRPDTSWKTHSITNLSFYLNKILGQGKTGAPGLMPRYILRNKAILALVRDPKYGILYADNLCFFRCLSVSLTCTCSGHCKCTRVKERHVRELFSKYNDTLKRKTTPEAFGGVAMSNLVKLEDLFQVSITVFTLDKESSNVIYSSNRPDLKKKLYLNLFQDHFSLIKRLDVYSKAYDCDKCGATYEKHSDLIRHRCQTLSKTRYFINDTFKPPPDVFQDLREKAGVTVDNDRCMYPYRITYDIESFMPKDNLPPSSAKLQYNYSKTRITECICVLQCS